MILGAIADDMTGGTDLALTLTREGMRVLQTVGVPDSPGQLGDFDAVVISLKSRTVEATEAVALSLAAARFLKEAGAELLFFKYCSTFDSTDHGNIGPVTAALLDELGANGTIACPAFPTNNRTVYRGHLFVGDLLLSDSPMRDHPLTPMHDANLVEVLRRQTKQQVSLVRHELVASGGDELAAAFAAIDGIAIVDAINDDDLRRIGTAALQLKLITGGSGVALGLPAALRAQSKLPARSTGAEPASPSGRQIVLAGSCSTTTRRQTAAAESAGWQCLRVSAAAILSGEITPGTAVTFAEAASGTPLIYSSAEPDEVRQAQQHFGRSTAGEAIENFMALVAVELVQRGFSRLLIAGGETSGAVVQALGVTQFAIGPEIAPGVPWTFARAHNRPLALALKSGNFGTDTIFLDAWTALT